MCVLTADQGVTSDHSGHQAATNCHKRTGVCSTFQASAAGLDPTLVELRLCATPLSMVSVVRKVASLRELGANWGVDVSQIRYAPIGVPKGFCESGGFGGCMCDVENQQRRPGAAFIIPGIPFRASSTQRQRERWRTSLHWSPPGGTSFGEGSWSPPKYCPCVPLYMLRDHLLLVCLAKVSLQFLSFAPDDLPYINAVLDPNPRTMRLKITPRRRHSLLPISMREKSPAFMSSGFLT